MEVEVRSLWSDVSCWLSRFLEACECVKSWRVCMCVKVTVYDVHCVVRCWGESGCDRSSIDVDAEVASVETAVDLSLGTMFEVVCDHAEV